jgi:RNA polymerase primary sigma factor
LKVISKSKGSDYLAEVWTRQKVEEALLLMQDAVSLNTFVGIDEKGNETELEDFIEDVEPSPEDEFLRAETRGKLTSYVDKYLSQRDANIIKMRFGFDTETPATLEEIGQQFGLTRERVRQIEQRALRKLRVALMRNNIKPEDI